MTQPSINSFIARAWKEETLHAMMRFISIPSLSPGFDRNWESNGYLKQVITDAIEFGRSYFPDAHFEALSEKGRSPFLFFDIPATGSKTKEKSVLFYGHLDKQPPNTGWTKNREAFKPSIEGSRLYGRGGADDGYSVYTAFTAIKSLRESSSNQPRCFGVIECSEECGSPDFEYWFKKISPRLTNIGMIAVLDSGAADYERLWITTTFRGMISFTLKASVLNHGVHSGDASGIVPESFTVLRALLNRIEDPETQTILDANFYTEVPPARLKQLNATAEILNGYEHSHFPWQKGVKPRGQNTFSNLLNQTWKPQLAVIGANALPEIDIAGNVLRTHTAVKLSFRIPAHVNARTALESVINTLTKKPPFNAIVTVENSLAHDGWDAPAEEVWFMDCAEKVCQEIFGKPVGFLAEGASIPILNLFSEMFPKAQFLVTGVLGPESNAHGPDEMLELKYVENLTIAIAKLMTALPE